MLRRLCTCVILLLGAASAHAQQSDSASPELVERALKGLDVAFEQGSNLYGFALQDRYLTLSRSKDGSRLLVKAPHQGRVTLDALNRYNEMRAITTRAVLTKQGAAVLETALDCRLGVQEETIRKFLMNFVTDINDFEAFLAKEPGAGKLVWSPKTAGQRTIPPLHFLTADQKAFEITFPAGGNAETAWKIVWDMQTGGDANLEGFKFGKSRVSQKLLFKIKKAYYRPGPQAPWVQVLEDAHAQEFYVPYLGFKGTYFFDLANVGEYEPLLAREGGQCSQLLGQQKLVMAELRDRGIAFKHHERSRRGEALALWANFVAGNYTYLVEFVFNDDGSINFRHAPTGYNYFDHFDKAAHMHNCLWRIGLKLRLEDEAGIPSVSTSNKVRIAQLRLDETKDGQLGELEFEDVGQERAVDWDPKRYTTLRVTNPEAFLLPDDAKRPERKLPISYDLVTTQQGQPRHLRDHERFSEHDFYVTRPDSDCKMYIHHHRYFNDKLKTRSLDGADGVVLWHMSSALHVPRGEDGVFRGNSSTNGQAVATWTTLDLRPRNLSATTPLYNVKP